MVRSRLYIALVLLLLLTMPSAGADILWPENTGGQRQLKDYVATANRFLQEQGEPGINSLFEAYAGFEVFGITDLPEQEIPEKVEITARLFTDSMNSLEVRVSDPVRFPRIAGSFLQALNPEGISRDEALKAPTQKMQQAMKAPESSFEDPVEPLNGTSPVVYYAYYPNQYSDGLNWLQMTIIFPLEGTWQGESLISGSQATRGPDTYSDHSSDYEGYDSDDDYVHYEIFVTATPEPDSAAAESFGR